MRVRIRTYKEQAFREVSQGKWCSSIKELSVETGRYIWFLLLGWGCGGRVQEERKGTGKVRFVEVSKVLEIERDETFADMYSHFISCMNYTKNMETTTYRASLE